MKIDLESKCSATHEWVKVATFRYSHMAVEAATSFSKWDQGTYRVVDKRFPDEGVEITLVRNGEVAA
jgi:hypothetical protein